MIVMINMIKIQVIEPEINCATDKYYLNRNVLIKAWNESDEELLGGSTARLPINPNNNIPIHRGVITSIPDGEQLKGIKNAQLRK